MKNLTFHISPYGEEKTLCFPKISGESDSPFGGGQRGRIAQSYSAKFTTHA